MWRGEIRWSIEYHQKAKAIDYSISDVEAWKRGEQTGLDTRVVHALNDEY
jgi:hypothetical protein